MATKHADEETFRYISMVNAIPALSREEELSLARAYLEDGDIRAKQRVIQCNLRHVVPLALRYRHFGVSLGELIAEGNLALVGALDRFEPQRGLRFATYANHWVRAEILGLVLKQRSMVGGGKGPLRAKYVFKLRREHNELVTRLGDQDAALEELGKRFRKAPEEVRDILSRIDSRDASLEMRVGEEGGTGATLCDMIAGSGELPEDEVAGDERRETVGSAVQSATEDLGERERYILENRLMADRDTRMSLVQIGKHFGVSRERARQLEVALKQKLRKRLADVASTVARDEALTLAA